MTLANTTVEDIAVDTLLSQSKPKIDGNFEDLIANDIDLDSRINSTLMKFTPEGGLAIRLLNKTGAASVKGSIVAASTGTAGAFMLQASELDAIGVVYESGIADAALCWVVVHGIAEVLLKNSTASTIGYFAKCADTDGRADITNAAPLGTNFAEVTDHFKEIGHCIESKVAGTNVLAKIILHFN